MRKLDKNKKILQIIIIFILTGIAIIAFLVWNKSMNNQGEEKCIDVHNAVSYSFDSCFDEGSKTLVLTSQRGLYDSYLLNNFEVTYTDSSIKKLELTEIPQRGESKIYYLSASKNPVNILINIQVTKKSNELFCDKPRRLFVKECDRKTSASISGTPLREEGNEIDLRTHLEELKRREESWKTLCTSSWDCSKWEVCQNGIQKRFCKDLNSCSISTNAPQTTRYCAESCIESWACTWSGCLEGETTPTCVDKNSCGTEHNLPKKLSCDFSDACIPDIVCGEWSECMIDYNLIDVQSQHFELIKGEISRLCIDKNSCSATLKEIVPCSTKIDVYTKVYSRCGKDYLEVYDRLSGDLVASLEGGGDEHPYLNVRLDEKRSALCEHCYNKILDGDETSIDCGGSCGSCTNKTSRSGPVNLSEKSFFEKVKDWLSNLF